MTERTCAACEHFIKTRQNEGACDKVPDYLASRASIELIGATITFFADGSCNLFEAKEAGQAVAEPEEDGATRLALSEAMDEIGKEIGRLKRQGTKNLCLEDCRRYRNATKDVKTKTHAALAKIGYVLKAGRGGCGMEVYF